MEKKYKIGEFAKNLGVSVGFLKHHEQDGILRPEVSENGYRYYSYSQTAQVFQCLRLQSLGFDSKEISDLLNNSKDMDIMELYSGKQKELQERIRFYSAIVEHLKALERAGLGQEQDGTWCLATVPPFVCIENSENGIFYHDEARHQATAQWNQCSPMIMTYSRIQWAENEKASIRDNIRNWYGGLMIDEARADRLNLFRNEAVQTIIPGQCLTYHLERVISRPSNDERDNFAVRLEDPIRLCRRHHFIPRGDIYVCQSFISNAREKNYISEAVMIPLLHDAK